MDPLDQELADRAARWKLMYVNSSRELTTQFFFQHTEHKELEIILNAFCDQIDWANCTDPQFDGPTNLHTYLEYAAKHLLRPTLYKLEWHKHCTHPEELLPAVLHILKTAPTVQTLARWGVWAELFQIPPAKLALVYPSVSQFVEFVFQNPPTHQQLPSAHITEWAKRIAWERVKLSVAHQQENPTR